MDLNELEGIASICELCDLHEGRDKPVFAKGSKDASIMICGMVPAKEENLAGIPFVGRAGKLLDEILIDSSLTINDVYITNLVKCFLAAGKKLDQLWISSCFPYLLVQIYNIKPKVIITLGKDASFALLGKNTGSLGSLVGKVHELDGTKLIATYHPSFLLRKGGKNNSYYDKVLEAFEVAKKIGDVHV
jgi:DNA polymerase